MRTNRIIRKTTYLLAAIGAALVLTAAVFISGTFAINTQAATYTINGVTLPLSETGYREGELRGAGKCWEFARHVYYKIWNRFFYQGGGTDDDMLREYPSGEERRITAEHARLFISAAPLGSVIRLLDELEGPDTTQCNRHSLILLDKTEDGCTLYHDWAGNATISTFTWAQFEYEFQHKIDFGYFKYIKYPGAKALQYSYSGETVEKEMVISSGIYSTAEIMELKR